MKYQTSINVELPGSFKKETRKSLQLFKNYAEGLSFGLFHQTAEECHVFIHNLIKTL
jgi:hypothetical protein